jgi:hypothetical protein
MLEQRKSSKHSSLPKGKGRAKDSPQSTSVSGASPDTPTTDGYPPISSSTSPQQGEDPFRDFFSSDDEATQATEHIPNLAMFLTESSGALYLSPPGAVEEDAMEESYFNFFHSQLANCFPYVNLFPWTAARLFSTSRHHPALRQSVLAVAALIADNNLGGVQTHRNALTHLQEALLRLRSQISASGADEGNAISSFLLAHFSMMLGDYKTAKKHLQGMSVVVRNMDPTSNLRSAPVPSPLSVSGLTMLIWRMAKRIDFISAIACGKEPVFPR